MRKNFFLGVPLERDADELGLVPVRAQLFVQRANVILGTTVHERDLNLADDDAANSHEGWGILP